ncbi:hypothetical protein FNYG_13837 [Fusarium nygamai]|uniref:Protein kinase domain-containing protein n=1 Tax=Gibberella nygamai TaxID=42673 RepID=A0A2K0UUI3_GIBNY|nr:hypothetical protein FNYG_13837 [Fusarium nygamai]
MHDDSEISSWVAPQEAIQFSNAQGPVQDEQNSVAQFYSTSGTSLYLTLLDVLSPAARVGLNCYQYEELINHIGQSLSHGKGSQFETFYARLKIPFGIEDLGSIVVVKRIRRDLPDQKATLRDLESLRREFQVLCHPPFRDHENIVKLLAFSWEQDYAAPILI